MLESKIEAVTIYHRGAMVERSAVVLAKDGRLPQTISFGSLPLALVDETVKVRVSGIAADGGEETILAVADFRVGISAHEEDGAIEPPDEVALEQASRALMKKTMLLQQLEKEESYLASLTLPARPEGEEGKPPPPSPMAARVALEQFTHDAIERRIVESQALRDEIEALQEEVSALRQRLAQVSESQRVKPHSLFKFVEARVRQGNAPLQQVRLALSYFVPGARWVPTYQCRLRRDGTTAEIQMRALVSQRTGEDWSRVKLALSTASPMHWSELPELSSLRIGKAQPIANKRGFRPPPKGAGALFGDYDQGLLNAREALPLSDPWAPISLYCAPLAQLAQIPEAPTLAAPMDKIQLQDEEDMSFMYTSQEDMPMAVGGGGVPLGLSVSKPKPPPAPPSIQMARSVSALSIEEEEAEEVDGLFMSALVDDMSISESQKGSFGGMAKERDRAPAKKKMGRRKRSRKESVELHYAQLELGEPSAASERGRLLPVDKRARYLRTLQRLQLEIHIDVMACIETATTQALGHDSLPLPEGTSDVKSAAGHFDYTYETDATVDVPADGLAHSIAVGSREANSDMHYVVVPREDPQAYRVASLRNPLYAPLLPGPAEIYIGGEFILSTQLPTVPPQGDLKLWLGVEQAIKCARNTRFQESRSGTKVVAMNELHHEIDIDIANRLSREIRCEIHERIPQPDKEAEIVVEEGDVTPAWETYDQEERGRLLKGGRRWRVSIPAGEEAALRARYTIKIYANNEIVGGNRREQ